MSRAPNMTGPTEMSAVLQEVASTRETAQKIANEGPTAGADVPRVLAGLVAHLAEQVERLAAVFATPADPSRARSAETDTNQDTNQNTYDRVVDAFPGDDVSPKDGPPAPGRDQKGDSG